MKLNTQNVKNIEHQNLSVRSVLVSNYLWFIVHLSFCFQLSCLLTINCLIIPHQKLLQSDWSLTHQHVRCLVLSPFESCHMIDIMLPRKLNICMSRERYYASLQTQYLSCVVQESNFEKSRLF